MSSHHVRKLALLTMSLLGALAVLPWQGTARPTGRALAPAVGASVEVVLTSANLRQALTTMPALSFSNVVPSGPVITVDENARDQAVKGVGGAMTDASAWLIYSQVSPAARASLMSDLFGTSGIHLSFMRVPMGASDFTAAGKPYSYDDLPPGHSDPALAHFSIRHDTRFIIPALQQALALNPGMFVLANPWSAPGWMKTNDALGNPRARGKLKSAAYGQLAGYFVKFLQAYASAGIQVNAVTPQNEPGQSSTYPGMNLSEAGEATFVRHDLVPALRSAGLATKIYGYDWGWASFQIPYARVLAASAAARDLAGISTHCYWGNPAVMSALHREAPALDEIVAECSPGIMPAPTSEVEIASMRNWASALDLWNLALDPSGGPVQPPNSACRQCTGIVTIDEATHKVTLTRDYYQLGQLSKYVQPGAVRIASNNFVRYAYRGPPPGTFATPGLDDVAFLNPDGSRVLLAYNNSTAPIAFAVKNDGLYFTYTLSARATGTFVWNQPAH